MNTKDKDVYERIAQIRCSTGLSTHAFSRRTGLPILYIEAIENSREHPNPPFPVALDGVCIADAAEILERITACLDKEGDEFPESGMHQEEPYEEEWTVMFPSTISRRALLDEIAFVLRATGGNASPAMRDQLICDYVQTPLIAKLEMYMRHLENTGNREALEALAREISELISPGVGETDS